MARSASAAWPTTPGSVFFGDVASAATLSPAERDGRIRRLARGVFTADQRAHPAKLIARNRWMVVSRLVPDAVVADRSAAEGGTSRAGVLTVVSKSRKEDLVLPGLVVSPRPGPGPLVDDPNWRAGCTSLPTLARSSTTSPSRGAVEARPPGRSHAPS